MHKWSFPLQGSTLLFFWVWISWFSQWTMIWLSNHKTPYAQYHLALNLFLGILWFIYPDCLTWSPFFCSLWTIAASSISKQLNLDWISVVWDVVHLWWCLSQQHFGTWHTMGSTCVYSECLMILCISAGLDHLVLFFEVAFVSFVYPVFNWPMYWWIHLCFLKN